MEKDWTVVYKAKNKYQADIIQGMLKENGVESVIINQKDSAYLSFGDTLLYVHNDNFDKARELIVQVEGDMEG